MFMETEKAMIRTTDEKVIRRALLPTLSIAIPRIGLRTAEIMYGTPNR